jgi:predicted RNase H-like HicB family nuclease
MTLKVILEEGADGYIIAECSQIPGCMSQGKTEEEALANIKDAVQACLKVMHERHDRGQHCSSNDTGARRH